MAALSELAVLPHAAPFAARVTAAVLPEFAAAVAMRCRRSLAVVAADLVVADLVLAVVAPGGRGTRIP